MKLYILIPVLLLISTIGFSQNLERESSRVPTRDKLQNTTSFDTEYIISDTENASDKSSLVCYSSSEQGDSFMDLGKAKCLSYNKPLSFKFKDATCFEQKNLNYSDFERKFLNGFERAFSTTQENTIGGTPCKTIAKSLLKAASYPYYVPVVKDENGDLSDGDMFTDGLHVTLSDHLSDTEKKDSELLSSLIHKHCSDYKVNIKDPLSRTDINEILNVLPAKSWLKCFTDKKIGTFRVRDFHFPYHELYTETHEEIRFIYKNKDYLLTGTTCLYEAG